MTAREPRPGDRVRVRWDDGLHEFDVISTVQPDGEYIGRAYVAARRATVEIIESATPAITDMLRSFGAIDPDQVASVAEPPAPSTEDELRERIANALVSVGGDESTFARIMAVVRPLLAAKDTEIERLRAQRDTFLSDVADDVRRYHADDGKTKAEIGRLIGTEDALNAAYRVFEIEATEVRPSGGAQ